MAQGVPTVGPGGRWAAAGLGLPGPGSPLPWGTRGPACVGLASFEIYLRWKLAAQGTYSSKGASCSLASSGFSPRAQVVVPPPLSRKPSENCMGQHRILMKGCNLNHGFLFFKYVYSFSTRRNQTQVQKEEASAQNNISYPQPREEEEVARKLVEDGRAGRRGDNDSSLPERAGPENSSAVEDGRPPSTVVNAGSGEARWPGPEAGADSGDPSLAPGTEGSGDFNFQDRAESGILVLSQHAVTAPREHEGSREGADGARREGDGLRELEGARERNKSQAGEAVSDSHEAEQAWEVVTTGHGPAEDVATAAEEEGSGHVTMLGTARGSDHGETTVGGGAALTSITENTEDVEVDAAGVDEYTYIPDAGAVTITRGATQVERAGLVQIPTKADDEVNIFIGKANIHVGEQGIATVHLDDNGHDAVTTVTGAGSQLPTPIATEERYSGQRTPGSGQEGGKDEGASTTVGHGDRDGPDEEQGLVSIAAQQEGRGAMTSPRPDEGDCTTVSGEAARQPGPGGSRQVRPQATGPRHQQKGAGLPKSPRGKEKGSSSRGRDDSGGEAPVVGQSQVTEATKGSHGDRMELAHPRPPAQAPLSVGTTGRGAAPGYGAAHTAAPSTRRGGTPRSPGLRGKEVKGHGGGRGRPGVPSGRGPAGGVARVQRWKLLMWPRAPGQGPGISKRRKHRDCGNPANLSPTEPFRGGVIDPGQHALGDPA
ncbi:PREDICTED: ovocleidin-116-like [Tinamus guttatus]|uniref:ovocleidin-116-like n=1 Tax=Tinamus guttatus TaxID=94827 RepID=UPI00052F0F8F|nr:PREDICTED: ovocleidin-116-like [Tinamus guttatus]